MRRILCYNISCTIIGIFAQRQDAPSVLMQRRIRDPFPPYPKGVLFMSQATRPRRPSAQKKGGSGKKKTRRKPLILRFLSSAGTVILTTFLSFFLLFAVTGTICAIAAAIYITDYMESTQKVSINELATSYETKIFERDPKNKEKWVEIYRVQAELQRIPVTLDKVPQYTRDAFVCAEDERFYSHQGVDYKRTAASFANMILHFWSSDQGGSTITQQLVKNLTQDDDKSPQRKIREIKRAMRLEKEYSKDDILEAYLNYIGFGGAANGIELAAKKYFGKSCDQLTIAESACLAAIPQSPEKNNPFAGYNTTEKNEVTGTYYYTDTKINTGREENRKRMEYILKQMYSNGAITFDEYQEALTEHLVFTDTDEYLLAHPELQKIAEDGTITLKEDEQESTTWVIDEALNEFASVLMQERGISKERAMTLINRGGYDIYLTVDREMQDYIEEKYADLDNLLAGMTNTQRTRFYRDLDGDGIRSDEESMTLQSGFTAIDYRGRILCTVGAVGEKVGSLGTSYASNEPQQPGSAIKPVTAYGYALENDYITWATHVLDYPPLEVDDTQHPGKKKLWPTNYADTNDVTVYTNQMIDIYYALQVSKNTIPALLCKTYGVDRVYDFATKTLGLKLTLRDQDYAPLSVGALDRGVTVTNLANAYMVYGSGGKYSPAHIIEKVVTTEGETKTLPGDVYNQVIGEDTAYIMNQLLQNVVKNGTGTSAQMYKNGRYIPIAGKTGTTSDWFDLTFVGLNPQFVSAVWLGYPQNKKINDHFSIKSPLLWKNIIGEWIQQHYDDDDFNREYPEPPEGSIVTGSVCAYTGKIAGQGCPKEQGVGYWKATNAPACDNRPLGLGYNVYDDYAEDE